MKQYVYVMRCGAGYHKIGRSHNPEIRRRNLTTSRAQDDITIVYTCGPFNNAGKIENGAHALLKYCRMAGEWFSCSQDQAIQAVQSLERNFVDTVDRSVDDGELTLRMLELVSMLYDRREDDAKIEEMTKMLSDMNLIFGRYRSEIKRLDKELCDAAKVVDSYADEAKQSLFLAKRSIAALEAKDREIAKLRDQLVKQES